MPNAPLSLTCRSTMAALKTGQEATVYVVVEVKAGLAEGQRPRPRLSAVVALDVSGSMQGQPLEHVRRSTERIAELLADGDSLGVVAFSSGGQVVAPLQRLGAESRRSIQRAVGKLQAEGGTNIHEGMTMGAQMFPSRAAGEQHLLLVLSDGQPNVGPSSARELGSEAARIKAQGVAVGTLGYGAHHDEKVLINVAEMGGGRYAFVNEPQLAEASFVQALGTQLDIVAENVRLVLTPSEDADIVRVLGEYKTSVGADGLRVALRDLAASESQTVVIEVRLRAWREGSWKALYATLTAQDALGGGGQISLQAQAPIEVKTGGPELADTEASAAAHIALADELRTRARGLADRGDFPGALVLLRQALQQIERSPGFRRGSGDRLDDVFDALTDDVTVYEQRPDAERYATYSKAQQDYLGLTKGGASNRVMSPTAQAMSAKRNAGPLPRARLVVISGSSAQERVIDDTRTVIGRGSSADMSIHHDGLSRQHALVELVGQEFWLVDLGSTNGTRVGGQIIKRHKLGAGEVFEVGSDTQPIKIRFERA